MSAKIPFLTVVSAATIGVFLGAAPLHGTAWQDAPPSSRSSTGAEETPPSVLLLTNGHVFQGEVREDATGYYLRHRIGTKQFARRNVAGVFRSIDEAYLYLAARVPKNDPDEHMRLARWCIEQQLNDRAREQLRVLLALNEDDPRAKSMMFHLDSRSTKTVDPDVALTKGEADAQAKKSNQPAELSRSVLQRLTDERNQRQAIGPPLIFNLPAPLAVRRYEEFKRYVHVELQNRCAKCHDVESKDYQGSFRLVRTQTRRDLANDWVVRANLDATLDLIDPGDLAHSKLLSAAAMTHPPDGKPVLGGPNHPSYRVLQMWVSSLRDPAAGEPNTAAAPQNGQRKTPVISNDADGFATGRQAAVGGTTVNRSGAASPIDSTAGQPLAGTPTIKDKLTGNVRAIAPGVPNDLSFPDPTAPLDKQISKQSVPARPAQSPSGSALDEEDESPATPQQRTRSSKPNVIDMPDGSQAIKMPNGELIPYVSREVLRRQPGDTKADSTKRDTSDSTKKKPDRTKALDEYLKQAAPK